MSGTAKIIIAIIIILIIIIAIAVIYYFISSKTTKSASGTNYSASTTTTTPSSSSTASLSSTSTPSSSSSTTPTSTTSTPSSTTPPGWKCIYNNYAYKIARNYPANNFQCVGYQGSNCLQYQKLSKCYNNLTSIIPLLSNFQIYTCPLDSINANSPCY